MWSRENSSRRRIFRGYSRAFCGFCDLLQLRPPACVGCTTSYEHFVVTLIFNLHLLTCKLFQKLNFFMIPKRRMKNLEHYFSKGVERGATEQTDTFQWKLSGMRSADESLTFVGVRGFSHASPPRALVVCDAIAMGKCIMTHIAQKPSTGYDINRVCCLWWFEFFSCLISLRRSRAIAARTIRYHRSDARWGISRLKSSNISWCYRVKDTWGACCANDLNLKP